MLHASIIHYTATLYATPRHATQGATPYSLLVGEGAQEYTEMPVEPPPHRVDCAERRALHTADPSAEVSAFRSSARGGVKQRNRCGCCCVPA